jgi:predicted transcriptional regulator
MKTSLYERLDDIVRKRKRSKQDNRTMSALIVEALEDYVKQIK